MSDFWVVTLSFLVVGIYIGTLSAIGFYTGMILMKKLWEGTR